MKPIPFQTFLVCFLALLSAACQSRTPPLPDAEMTSDSIRFLALGDSYTIGEEVDPSARWPVQLAQRLREEGFPVEDPLIVAQTGWTTDELDAGIDSVAPEGPFDLVTLLIGVNNQYRGRPLPEYRTQVTALMERAMAFSGGRPERVVVLSIPDWGVMPFAQGRDREAIASEINAFNQVNRVEAEDRGLSYVDVTGISRAADPRSELVASDGLHPSGEQYRRWAEIALPVVGDMLAKEGG